MIASGVKKVTHTSTSNGSTTTTTTYRPEIAYEYNVAGQRYVNAQLTTGAQPSDYVSAEQKAAQYPIGKIVTIFHAPNDPQQATLEFTKSSGGCLIGVGLALIAFTLLMVALLATPLGQQFADFMNSLGS